MDASDAEVRQWFLGQGLPLVVSRRWRGRRLWRRSAPAVAAFAVLGIGGILALRALADSVDDIEEDAGSFGWEVLFWLSVLGFVAVPLAVAWGVARLVRGRRWQLATVGAYVVSVVGVPAVFAAVSVVPVAVVAAVMVGIVVLVAGFIYLGAGSLLAWAIRYAAREVSAVAQTSGRLVPLLLLILVVFFTGELWQWAARVARGQVWGTVALLAVIGVVFMATSLRDEVGAVEERRRNREPEPLDGTPFAGTDVAAIAPTPLRRGERLNVFGKLLVAQLIQTLVFGIVVMAFFVALGTVMLPDGIIATWSGHDVEPGTLFGGRLPVPQALLQMSMLMAALSGLYFAVNTSTDAQYRRRFFDPLLAELAVALAARDVYLTPRR